MTDLLTWTTLRESILISTNRLLLDRGLRHSELADVARDAGLAPATLADWFPDGMTQLLGIAYEENWQHIHRATAQAHRHADALDPVQRLLTCTGALWAMRTDENDCLAATAAFLLRRQKGRLGWDVPDNAESQVTNRLNRVGTLILAEHAPDLADADANDRVEVFAKLVVNYAATVWLTWFCLPGSASDANEFSLEEAQMGVLLIAERVLGRDSDPARLGTPLTHPDDC